MRDPKSADRIQAVMPELREKIEQMDTVLVAGGIEIRVVQARRTTEEQDALYQMGRTTPSNAGCVHHGVTRPVGSCDEHPLGAIVTNCPGGHSYHEFGLAIDGVPSTHAPDQPYDPDWNSSHPAWKRMEAVGLSLGLDVGAQWRSFPDAPHFQLTGRFPEGAPNDEVRKLFAAGGLEAVWAAVRASMGGDPSSPAKVAQAA